MLQKRKVTVASLLTCSAVITYAIFLWLMYKSGCAGDMKTGAYGDIAKALELENKAFLSLYASALFILIAYIVASKRHIAVRISSGVAIGMVYFLFALYTGGSVQIDGISICNP